MQFFISLVMVINISKSLRVFIDEDISAVVEYNELIPKQRSEVTGFKYLYLWGIVHLIEGREDSSLDPFHAKSL